MNFTPLKGNSPLNPARNVSQAVHTSHAIALHLPMMEADDL
jgi:hypothetical protein